MLPYTNAHWRNFFKVAGRPELADDPRFKDATSRSRHINEVYGVLADLVAQRSTAEWIELMKDADIPMTPILSPEDLLTDPHLKAVDFFKSAAHPTEGDIRTIGMPVRYSRTPTSIRRQVPTLGEHTQEIRDEVESRKR
jgi:crotonobetainyl-CoA:carnitine CoA-transferase CaiB-like acyl-CoA transferase